MFASSGNGPPDPWYGNNQARQAVASDSGTGGTSPIYSGDQTVTLPPPVPNWSDLLNNNPYLLAQRALSAEQLAALKATTGASMARALINLGDASLAKNLGGITLPGNTNALVDEANKSGTSVLAQMLHQHNDNTQQIPAQLAGRGFYRSGETGYELGNENRAYGLHTFDARQKTLDYLNGLYQNYLNAQFGIQQQNMNAYFQAYQQALAQAQNYSSGPGTQVPITGNAPPDAGAAPSNSAVWDNLEHGAPKPWTSGQY